MYLTSETIIMNTMNTLNTTPTSAPTTGATGTSNLVYFQQWHKDIAPETYLSSGQRVVVLNYKAAAVGANKGKKAAQDSFICIPDHITADTVRDNLDSLLPSIIYMLQKAEASLLRKEHVAGAKSFSASWFSIDKVTAYLEEQGQSKRLSKADISLWWKDSGIASAFSAALAAKGFDSDQIAASASVYLAKLESLANPHTTLPEQEQEQLVKVLELSEKAASLPVGKAIAARIVKMVEQVTDALDAL